MGYIIIAALLRSARYNVGLYSTSIFDCSRSRESLEALCANVDSPFTLGQSDASSERLPRLFF